MVMGTSCDEVLPILQADCAVTIDVLDGLLNEVEDRATFLVTYFDCSYVAEG